MSLLITLLKAAHCRSTHHYLAIDALRYVSTQQGKRLASILLANHAKYLVGAKDPDKKFRDFQNHVLHVGDGHWGGACSAAQKWCSESLQALTEKRWAEASYAMGVLSHYFTDPLMPLHTGSSDKEGVVHRPMEWSVCKSYSRLLEIWEQTTAACSFAIPSGDRWLSDAVTQAALLSHPHYQRVIEIYDLEEGVQSPPDGLNAESRRVFADMIGFAVTGLAGIIDRVAEHVDDTLPEQGLTLPTLAATIKIPAAWVTRKIESSQERRAVAAILAEYQQTGTVAKNLPDEVNCVRDHRQRRSDNLVQPSGKAVQQRRQVSSPAPDLPTRQPQAHVQQSDSPQAPRSTTRTRKSSVNRDSDLVDAPSIGPKTAKRFAKIGIHTIGQFLSADPAAMERDLETRWIKSELLSDWQSQAALVCDVPALCGYKAQLLEAVECRNVSQLAAFDVEQLTSMVVNFSQTSDGQRILRSSKLPQRDEIAKWIAGAQEFSRGRAA